MTLTAKWTENVYTVSFINGKGSTPSSISVTFGRNCYIQEPLSQSGFIFDGWYYGDKKIEFGSKWDIASDVTLTAKWVEIVTTYDTTYDSISIKDLTFNGQTNQMVIKDNKNTDCSYIVNDEEKSLVFKFYYDVLDDTATESNAVRIHFDVTNDMWNIDNCLWIRGDRIFMSTYETATSKIVLSQSPALDKGAHSIEFGRLAVLENGNETGRYYVYYKVDGVVVDSSICPYNKSNIDGTIFINFSDGNKSNKMYDISNLPGYEVSDLISINSLFSSNNLCSNEIKLDEHKSYKYVSTQEHKSVVLRFLYDVRDLSTIDCQFHFSNTWLGDNHGGIISFKNDKNRISKVSSGYVECSPFNKIGLYEIEIGKLYITSGANAGKYYIYLSVDKEKVLEYVISSMPDSDSIFITGTNGDYLYDINYMPVELGKKVSIIKNIEDVGIEFTASFRKDFKEKNNIVEAGFILYSADDIKNTTKVVGKLNENGNYYIVNANVNNLSNNPALKYVSKFYYVTIENDGKLKTHYKDTITASLYDCLNDLDSLDDTKKSMINEYKGNILYVSLSEDTCEINGALISGNFESDEITITGSKSSYNMFVLNDELLENDKIIKIGYLTYKVTLSYNIITLLKQDKKMIYGGSEHFKEMNSGHDEKMTAENLSPMMVEIGLTTVRFDFYFGKLFSVLENDELSINTDYVAQVQSVIDELKTNGGVTDFLGVFWTLLPNEYPVTWEGKPWTEKVCPDYKTEKEAYLKWLQINAEAARLTAELFKDVTNFETWNEAEIMQEEDGLISRKDGTNYSVTEKAKILTDLMYYYNKAIKSVSPNNKLTTPSLCTKQDNTKDSNFDIPSVDFLVLLYEEITNDTPVTGYTVCDKDPNHYFDVINIHPYIEENQTPANWYLYVKSFHDVSITYGDKGTEIWGTEFGFPTNTRTDALSKTTACLTLIEDLDYMTKLYFYKVHDYTSRINGDKWGLYDYDGNIKPLGELVKDYINNAKD